MWRVAMRNLRATWTRLVMTLVTVVLGVTFVAGTLVFTDSIAPRPGVVRDDVAVLVAPNTSFARISQAKLDELRALPGVTGATAIVRGYAAAIGADGKVARGAGFSDEITGTNWTDSLRLRLVDGRAPRQAGEVAVERVASRNGGLTVGGTTRVAHRNGTEPVRVVGIFTYHPPAREGAGAGPSVAFDTATAQRLMTEPGTFTHLELAGTPGEALRARVAAALPGGYEAVDGARLAAESRAHEAGDAAFTQQVLLGFTLVSLLVGAILIANTFTVLIGRRTRELALLRCVGASRRQIRRSVLIEAAVVGAAGTAGGLAAGIGLAALMTSFTASRDPMLGTTLVISLRGVATTLVVGIGMTILAAWVPARRAAAVPPVAGLREAGPRDFRIRTLIGKLVALVAALLLAIGVAGVPGLGPVAAVSGAFVLLVAAVLLAGGLSAPLLRSFGVLARHRTALVTLATENGLRNRRRTAATVSALLIGVALATGIAVFSASVTEADRAAMERHLAAEYVVAGIGDAPIGQRTVSRLGAVPGVDMVAVVRTDDVKVDGGESEQVAAVDPAALGPVIRLELSAGRPRDLAGGLFVSAGQAEDRGWKPGDRVRLGATSLPITGVFRQAPLTDADLLVSADFAAAHFGAAAARGLVLVSADSGAHRGLDAAVRDRPDVRVFTAEDYIGEVASQFGPLLWISTAMLGLALLIALLGVVNTLALSVMERTREIGLLRAVGMRRGQVRAMIRIEAILIAVAGSLLGVAVGLVIGAVLQTAVLGGTPLDAAVPAGPITGLIAALAAAAVLGAALPARHAARTDTLRAIAAP